jgi:hypothetical protein
MVKGTLVKIPSSALHLFLWGALLAVAFAPIQAQTTPDPLFKTIQSLDAQLFDAYNRCDLKTFAAMRDDNLELYHDPENGSRDRLGRPWSQAHSLDHLPDCPADVAVQGPRSLLVFRTSKAG